MSVALQNTSERVEEILDKVRALGPTLRERGLAAERAGRHSDESIADLDATSAFIISSPAETRCGHRGGQVGRLGWMDEHDRCDFVPLPGSRGQKLPSGHLKSESGTFRIA